jgi:diguanylate cyclase (GGDEF)-like protein
MDAQRHLKAVPEHSDAFEALRRAVRIAIAAPDLASALDEIASCLVAAVGARTAVVVAADGAGTRAEATAGPMAATEALHLAVHSDDGDEDIVIRYIGVSAKFGRGAPRGAVLVVVPSAEAASDGPRIAGVVQAFAELAELCVIHAERLHQAERQSDDDVLTRCRTRRAIERSLAAELTRSSRSQAPFSIAFLDIDDFKQINDEQGHVRGDAVLSVVGGALCDASRSVDAVGRYGGDEFLVVMPATDAASAATTCDRLTAHVAAAVLAADLPAMRMSYGVATWAPGSSATDLIERADQEMFRAKRSARGA